MNAIKDYFSKIGYAFYLIFHPFKAFWDLKHDKIGEIKVASAFVGLLAIISVLGERLTGFIVNGNDVLKTNALHIIIRVLAVFAVWVIANWSITTLLDGEGKLRDIYIATAYAIVPYLMSNIIMIILSNVIIIEEATFYYLFSAIGLIWSGFLLIAGLMTIHQFSFLKTIATIIIAVVAMIIILFLFLMLITLFQEMFNFVSLLYQEVFL